MVYTPRLGAFRAEKSAPGFSQVDLSFHPTRSALNTSAQIGKNAHVVEKSDFEFDHCIRPTHIDSVQGRESEIVQVRIGMMLLAHLTRDLRNMSGKLQ
jgi:hypothetical protein